MRDDGPRPAARPPTSTSSDAAPSSTLDPDRPPASSERTPGARRCPCSRRAEHAGAECLRAVTRLVSSRHRTSMYTANAQSDGTSQRQKRERSFEADQDVEHQVSEPAVAPGLPDGGGGCRCRVGADREDHRGGGRVEARSDDERRPGDRRTEEVERTDRRVAVPGHDSRDNDDERAESCCRCQDDGEADSRGELREEGDQRCRPSTRLDVPSAAGPSQGAQGCRTSSPRPSSAETGAGTTNAGPPARVCPAFRLPAGGG